MHEYIYMWGERERKKVAFEIFTIEVNNADTDSKVTVYSEVYMF